MRKRNYFLLALASMAFAACSNDDFVADVDNGIITEPTGDAWVALNVRPPSLASTRGCTLTAKWYTLPKQRLNLLEPYFSLRSKPYRDCRY